MRAQPIPLIGQFYADDARPWSMQDVCNYLPAAAETEGTRTPTICKTPPGLSPLVQLPSEGSEVPVLPGPIRGLHNAEGRVFAASTSRLWQISPQGVAIPRGTIGGTSRVKMAHNQQTFGNEVILVNGSSGYLYNTVTQAFAPITDDGYPGAIDVVFLDGYFIQIEPARRFAFNSGLADGGSYNTLDRWTSEVSPDLLVGLATTQNELILFSEGSAEFFTNEGHAQQPFRSKRISLERGAASRYGQAHLDNTVFWLGNDGKFYVLEGYTPKRISTRPIEQAIRGLNWGQAFAFVWESEGHAVVYWTFPDGQTWGYDASQGRWHRRASYGLDRWRVNCTAAGFTKGQTIAGDFQAGRLWDVDWDYPWEYQTEFVSEIVTHVVHDNQALVLMPRFEVLMDVGQPEVEIREFPDQPDGPSIEGDAPDGVAGFVYTPFSYTATPGDAPIASFTITSGTLPPGLTLSTAGILSGTPTEEGAFTFTVRATDTNGLYDELSDTVEIAVAMFLAVDNLTVLNRSLDGGDDEFIPTVTTGLTVATPNVYTAGASGNLFHFGGSYNARMSDDMGATWNATTGLDSAIAFAPYRTIFPGEWTSAAWNGSGYALIDGTGVLGPDYEWTADGRVWIARRFDDPGSTLTADQLVNVAAIGSTFVGFNGSEVAVSTDNAVTWSPIPLPAWLLTGPNVSAGCNGEVMFVTDRNVTTGRALVTNGVTIDQRTLPSTGDWFVNTAVPGGGNLVSFKYATNASAYSSDNGATWNAATLPSSQNWSCAASRADGLIVLAPFGSASGARSTDGGQTWAALTLPGAFNWTCGLAVGNVLVLTVQNSADCYISRNDGTTWEIRPFPNNSNWSAIATNGSDLVAVSRADPVSTVNAALSMDAGNLMLVGAEWQFYHHDLHVSSDGVAWTKRTISSGALDTVQMPVRRSSLILCAAQGNVLNVSTDAGQTFTEYTVAAFHSEDGVQRLLSIGSTKFLAFGRNSSGNLLIGSSTSGLSGSWSTVAGPETSICHGVARDPDSGRILIVLANGNSWFSDDDGVTWEAGLPVPYTGALAFPPLHTNNMVYSNGAFWFCSALSGGVNRLYLTIDGETPWGWTYGNTDGNEIHSVCELLP